MSERPPISPRSPRAALEPEERATLWRLLTRALYGAEASSTAVEEAGLTAAR